MQSPDTERPNVHTDSASLPDPSTTGFREGQTITVHGDMQGYPAIILTLYRETQRASVQWWCDVRQTWFIGAVDMVRIEAVRPRHRLLPQLWGL